MSQPCALYRHFDAEGRLLYVGISLSAVVRLSQHRHESRWFTDIASVTIEWLGSREEASAAEQKAVREEKPIHNRMRFGSTAPDPLPVAFRDEARNAGILLRLTGQIETRYSWDTVDGCSEVLGIDGGALMAMLDLSDKDQITFAATDVLGLSDRVIHGTAASEPKWVLGSSLPDRMTFVPKGSVAKLIEDDQDNWDAVWAAYKSSAPSHFASLSAQFSGQGARP